MVYSTPGFPVNHQLPKLTQTRVHLSSQWCHPTISTSVIPFSSCLQSFPASGSFPMSQLFTSGGQNIGVSASVSVLPMNIQGWFPLGPTGWIFLNNRINTWIFDDDWNVTLMGQNNFLFEFWTGLNDRGVNHNGSFIGLQKLIGYNSLSCFLL